MITKQVCPGCKKLKPINRFKEYNGKRCLDCRNIYYRKWRKKNPGKALLFAQKHQRTYQGRKTILWQHILIRLKGDKLYRNIKLLFTKEDLFTWLDGHKRYKFVYDNWVKQGYQLKHTPTIDRINSEGNYELNNIQILTHQENSCKRLIISKLIIEWLKKNGLWDSVKNDIGIQYNEGLKTINSRC